jgi:hypothetical protein
VLQAAVALADEAGLKEELLDGLEQLRQSKRQLQRSSAVEGHVSRLDARR